MPILYPIGLLAMIILYVTERLTLAYYYKIPPQVDSKVLMDSIWIMKWGIVGSFYIGYWMFSNNQIFSNWVFPVSYNYMNEATNHTFISSFAHIYSLPHLFIGITLTIYFGFIEVRE